MRRCLVQISFSVLFLLPGARAAFAQCNQAVSSLESVRGSRFLVLDYDELQANLDRDLGAHDQAESVVGRAHVGRVFAAFGGDDRTLGGYNVCTDRGSSPGQLEQLRGGITAGYQSSAGWGFRLTWMVGQDRLQFGDRRREATDQARWAFDQDLYALEVRPLPRLAVAFARLGGESEYLSPSSDGEMMVVPTGGPAPGRLDVPTGGPAPGRLDLLSVRTGWLGGNASALWGTGGLALVSLGLDDIPLVDGWSAIAAAGLLVDENLPTSRVGLRWSRGNVRVTSVESRSGQPTPLHGRVGGSVAVTGSVDEEYRPFGLRDARLRLDGSFLLQVEVVSMVIDWGAYLETTVVGSRELREATGRTRAPGVGGGIQGVQGLRFGSVVFDVYAGVNRPETLALVPQAVAHPELRGQVLWRLGW